jgi:hypothetical protein
MAHVSYPAWSYFPANTQPPTWVNELAQVVDSRRQVISTEVVKTGLSSDSVLRELAAGLTALGFQVEDGKARMGKIERPVLFGENGRAAVTYEVDGFHDTYGIVLEVEAGRGARGNAEYRDLFRSSLILDAKFLVLMLPIAYRFNSGGREGTELAYRKTRDLLSAVYASQRLRFPFEGIVLIGY